MLFGDIAGKGPCRWDFMRVYADHVDRGSVTGLRTSLLDESYNDRVSVNMVECDETQVEQAFAETLQRYGCEADTSRL